MKRALCIGIDQVRLTGVPWLLGCSADARAMNRLLTERFGFQEVAELHNHEATRDGILRSLDWLARVSGPGDAAVVFIASYGTWFPPGAGHDGETLDEVVVVYDHDWQWTMLRDDDLMQGFCRFHPGVAIACLLDACHSGGTGPGIRCLAPPSGIGQVAWARQRGLLVRPRFQYRRPEDHPNLLYMSACAPNESAVEVPIAQGAAGAFTLALTDTLGNLAQDISWDQAADAMVRSLAARGLRQTPQLYGPPYLRAQRMLGGASAAAPSPAAGGWAPAPGVHGPSWTPAVVSGGPSWGAMSPQQALSGPPSAAQPVVSFLEPPVSVARPAIVAPVPDVLTPVDTALLEFADTDYTAKLCRAVFAVVPYVPKPRHYPKLRDAVVALQPGAEPAILALAQEHAQGEAVGRTLWVASAIDTGDAGIAVYSGLKSAVGLFLGGKSSALETDPQQAVDAALKLLALSYMIYRLFPGSVPERVKSFYSIPAGQSLAAYYAAIEVALPFADNAAAAGGRFLHNLMSKYGGDAGEKLSSTVGKESVEGSKGVLGTILAPMEGMVERVIPLARQIAETASKHMPNALNVADKVAGVVATGADALPAYRYLGARLAAEACGSFAIKGIPAT